MSKKRQPLDEFYYHEALDRSYVVAQIIDSTLLTHPVIQKHRDLKKRVSNAQQLIVEAYQLIGGLEMSLFPPNDEELPNPEIKE